jgi:hypothetical protein
VSTHLKALLAVCLLAAWLAFSALANEPRVAIRNRGGIGSEPADWVVTVVVDPREEHRLLILEADGNPGEFRSTDEALAGLKAAKIRQVWFKGLRSGCYDFIAKVKGSGGRESPSLGEAHAGPVHIIGREGDPCGDAASP